MSSIIIYGFLLILFLIGAYFFSIIPREKKSKKARFYFSENEIPSTDYKEKIFTAAEKTNTPEICPHCKSPNTQKIRICEWCGSQII